MFVLRVGYALTASAADISNAGSPVLNNAPIVGSQVFERGDVGLALCFHMGLVGLPARTLDRVEHIKNRVSSPSGTTLCRLSVM